MNMGKSLVNAFKAQSRRASAASITIAEQGKLDARAKHMDAVEARRKILKLSKTHNVAEIAGRMRVPAQFVRSVMDELKKEAAGEHHN